MKVSRIGIIVAALPNLLLIGLFYSLAFHMFRTLGRWPYSIGDRGFPPSLIAHENITVYYFVGLIWFGTFVWPLAMLLCLLVRRWRRVALYLGFYALLFLGCWGLMQLAPVQFLDWWRD